MAAYEWGENLQLRILALLVKQPILVYEYIEPQFFTNPVTVDIARVVKQAYSKVDLENVQLSKTTLKELVKAGISEKDRKQYWKFYKRRIKKIYSIRLRDDEILAAQAMEFSKEQKYREVLIDSERDIRTGRYDLIHKKIKELEGFGADPDLGISYWEGIKDKNRYRDDRIGLVPTGFKKLDRCLWGGIGAGELAIGLGGGKVGKSTLLSNITVGAMRQGKNVAIASAELSGKKYRRRIDALITGIKSADLMKLRRTARKRLKRASRLIHGQAYIKQFPTGKASVGDIERWLYNLEKEGLEIDLLVVDYLMIFQPNLKSKERRFNIGQVAVELRGLAVEKQIPVWTVSQGRRSALGKAKLTPQDFAEDISLFWTLDFCIALCQTEKEEKSEPPRGRLYLAAARDVRAGDVISVEIDRDIYKIYEKAFPKKEDDDEEGYY